MFELTKVIILIALESITKNKIYKKIAKINIHLQPGPRYFDTAFVIFQQWLHNELWTSADSNKLVRELDLGDMHTTSNGSLKSSSLPSKRGYSKLGTKLKPKTKTKYSSAENKKKFRRSLSDPATCNELKIIERDLIRKSLSDDENNKIPVSSSYSTLSSLPPKTKSSSIKEDFINDNKNSEFTSGDNDITVCVDIHQPKLPETNNNTIVSLDKTKEVPEKPLDEIDNNSKSQTVSRTSSIRSDKTLTGIEMSVPIRRKQIRLADPDERVSSSFDESDADPVYEKVNKQKVSKIFATR